MKNEEEEEKREKLTKQLPPLPFGFLSQPAFEFVLAFTESLFSSIVTMYIFNYKNLHSLFLTLFVSNHGLSASRHYFSHPRALHLLVCSLVDDRSRIHLADSQNPGPRASSSLRPSSRGSRRSPPPPSFSLF